MANKKTLIREAGRQALIDSNKLVATETAAASGNFNLLFPIPSSLGTGTYTRLYQWGTSGGQLWFVNNCYWDEATLKWIQEDAAQSSFGFHLDGEMNIKRYKKDAGAMPWGDVAWDTEMELDHNGNVSAYGPTTVFFGIQGYTNSSQIVGTGVTFPKQFPFTPSNFTPTITSSNNVATGSLYPSWDAQTFGCGVYIPTLGAGNFYCYGYLNVDL